MLGIVVVALRALPVAAGRAQGPLSADSFSIVVLPDTQWYSVDDAGTRLFSNQTKWIADAIKNRGNPDKIAFVTHVGDLVEDGTDDGQWSRARAAMAPLGPSGGPYIVPYSVLPGNHDYPPRFVVKKIFGATKYVANFGPHYFKGAPWFGGADPSGMNTFQLFSAGGRQFLHLALEWKPEQNMPVRSPSPLEWAAQVLDAHPTVPTVVTTHEYVNDMPARRSPSGEVVFRELVKSRDQIFLILCGHYHNMEAGGPGNAHRLDGQYHQISSNDRGRPVVEVLQDYQDFPQGGGGFLRLITFDFAHGALRFDTFSPALGSRTKQPPRSTVKEAGPHAGQFTITLDLASRVRPLPPPPPQPSMRPSPPAAVTKLRGVMTVGRAFLASDARVASSVAGYRGRDEPFVAVMPPRRVF